MPNTKPRITKRFVAVSSLATVGFLILLLISLAIRSNTGLAALDRSTLDWFTDHRSEWLTNTMHVLTTLVSAELLLVVAAIVSAVWFWRTRERWRPLFLLFSFGSAIVVAWLVKLAVGRLRPLPDTMLPPLETGYSLPSIHTFGAAMFVLILGYMLYSKQRNTLWLWITLAALFTGIAGITRLYLGYHWLTDLIASVGLALIALAAIIAVDTHWQSRRGKPAASKRLK